MYVAKIVQFRIENKRVAGEGDWGVFGQLQLIRLLLLSRRKEKARRLPGLLDTLSYLYFIKRVRIPSVCMWLEWCGMEGFA